jgi:hypothetical protein
MVKALADGRQPEENVMVGMTYLGQQAITMNSGSQACTLPTGTNFVEISASAGAVQYTINGAASADSGGYVPENQTRYILKLDNLTSLYVYGVSPAKAHLIYKQEQ